MWARGASNFWFLNVTFFACDRATILLRETLLNAIKKRCVVQLRMQRASQAERSSQPPGEPDALDALSNE